MNKTSRKAEVGFRGEYNSDDEDWLREKLEQKQRKEVRQHG